jgi:hypothetical protein
MSGISFVIDEHGKKTAAVIDLRRHGQLWEDIYDSLVVAARAHEPRESLEEVKRRLKSRSKGNG